MLNNCSLKSSICSCTKKIIIFHIHPLSGRWFLTRGASLINVKIWRLGVKRSRFLLENNPRYAVDRIVLWQTVTNLLHLE